jgi:hypothetical protein
MKSFAAGVILRFSEVGGRGAILPPAGEAGRRGRIPA